jgi:hypothetical protein
MRRPLATCLIAIGAAACLVTVAPAWAQPVSPSEIAAAKQWFNEGIVLEERGQWADALEQFRRAATVRETPQILFHRGLCEKHTGLLLESADSLTRSAAMAQETGLAEVERWATVELADARERTPTLQIALPPGRTATRTLLDGVELSAAMRGMAFPVNPGTHVVTVEFGTQSVRMSTTLRERDTVVVSVRQPERAVPADHPDARSHSEASTRKRSPTPTASTPTTPSQDKTLAWTLAGSGAAAAAAGAVMWVLRDGQLDKLEAACPGREDCPPEKADELDRIESRGRLYGGLAFGFWVAGAASLAVGGVLIFRDDDGRPHADVAPALGRSFAGLTVTGSY